MMRRLADPAVTIAVGVAFGILAARASRAPEASVPAPTPAASAPSRVPELDTWTIPDNRERAAATDAMMAAGRRSLERHMDRMNVGVWGSPDAWASAQRAVSEADGEYEALKRRARVLSFRDAGHGPPLPAEEFRALFAWYDAATSEAERNLVWGEVYRAGAPTPELAQELAFELGSREPDHETSDRMRVIVLGHDRSDGARTCLMALGGSARDPRIRGLALARIWLHPADTIIPFLRERLAEEPDAKVRGTIEWALENAARLQAQEAETTRGWRR